MACYNPRPVFLVKNVSTGRNRIVFPSRKVVKPSDAIVDWSEEDVSDMALPCTYCAGCKLEYARQWSLKCMHEASFHNNNCFITLTYSDQHLPNYGSLDKSHFSKFIKALRERLRRAALPNIKFFHCGEYGDKLGRPHYHALIFGYDFPDKVFRSSRRGNDYYESPMLDEIWGKGKCIIGNVTLQSAGYVARYALKKRYGYSAKNYYGNKVPEYAYGSNGIGRRWIEQHWREVYAYDRIVMLNTKNKPVIHKPPRYYDDYLRKVDPLLYEKIKIDRIVSAESKTDNTPQRLKVKEECKLSCVSRLFREYDEESCSYADITYDPHDCFSPSYINPSGT